MIPILLVGDGHRDEAVVPTLVENILGRACRWTFRPWARLHGQRGYASKLGFALLQARDGRQEGLVAVADADADANRREKLNALRAGRDADRRKNPPIPTALGCAVPHGEAWLYYDSTAVREVLGIPATEGLPHSNQPKAALDKLFESLRPSESKMDLLREIARRVQVDRCAHMAETGLSGFVEDLRAEYGKM